MTASRSRRRPPEMPCDEADSAAESASSHGISGGRLLLLLAVIAGLAALSHRYPPIGRRLLLMIPTLLIVSLIVFTLVQLPPGDYAAMRVARLEMEGTPSNDEL